MSDQLNEIREALEPFARLFGRLQAKCDGPLPTNFDATIKTEDVRKAAYALADLERAPQPISTTVRQELERIVADVTYTPGCTEAQLGLLLAQIGQRATKALAALSRLEAAATADYERGRQDGMKQEHALWQMQRIGHEIEAAAVPELSYGDTMRLAVKAGLLESYDERRFGGYAAGGAELMRFASLVRSVPVAASDYERKKAHEEPLVGEQVPLSIRSQIADRAAVGGDSTSIIGEYAGENNAQLDRNSNDAEPEQQRPVAGAVALGQSVGGGSDAGSGHPTAEGAERVAVPVGEVKPVAWEGGEGWESLAWELCADENGEEACTELIWEGGPIPEPWGDRWMKYEGEAKRLIALVHKHTTPPAPPEGWRKDAERYRWLVRQFGVTALPVFLEERILPRDYVADGKESIDAKIDAAMAAAPQPGDKA